MEKLYLGDCLEVMKSIPDKSIDMVLVDPPYKVISGGNKSKEAGWHGSVLEKNDGKIFKHNDIKFSDYLPQLFRILKEGSHCYVMVNFINLNELLIESKKAGFEQHNLLVWEKNNKVLSRWYMKNAEYILFLYKKPAKKINNIGTPTILKANNPRNKIHPTEKPVELLEIMINNSSKENEIILDCFAGSGTTGVACKNTNRQFILIEKDPEYCKIIEERCGIKAETIGQEVEVEKVKSIIKPVKVRQNRCPCGGRIVKTKSGVLTCEDCLTDY